MAERYAVATGNWSAVGTWDGGTTLPDVGDTVHANGYDVTVNQDVVVASITTAAGATAVAGGNFNISTTRSIAANITGGTTPGLSISAGTTTITGDVTGVSNPGISLTGTGSVSVNGDVNGGTWYGIQSTATGNITVVGDVSAGTTGGTDGIFITSGTVVLTVTGSVDGGDIAAARGINVTGGTVTGTITGTLTGGAVNGGHALQLTSSSANVSVVGNIIGGGHIGSQGANITASARLNHSGGMLIKETGNPLFISAATYNPSMDRDDYDYPIASNVSSGVSYGVGGFTGSLSIPAASDVRSGVSFAATTGTLDLPDISDVVVGVTFDNSTKTGTFTFADSADYDDIRRRVSRYLGYSTTWANLSSEEQQQIEDIVNDGLRWVFYSHEIPHDWTFLRKPETATVAAGTYWYDLPVDFVRMLEEISVSGVQNLSYTTEADLRARIANAGDSGPPRYAAIRLKSGQTATQYQIGFYPVPASGTVDAEFWYLSESPTLVPVGGAIHSETIIAACLAAAARSLNAEDGQTMEMLYADFKMKLKASVDADRKLLGMETE